MKALSADPDKIMHTTAGDVGIYYADDGQPTESYYSLFWHITGNTLISVIF